MAGLLQGISLAYFGAFQDSLNYYQLFESVSINGSLVAIRDLIALSSKFEPGIVLLFSIESFFFGSNLSEFWFLVLNMTLLNILICCVMFSLKVPIRNEKSNLFLASFIAVMGYLVFSKELYFWKSILAACFFIGFVRCKSWKRFALGIFSVLCHASFLAFIILFLFTEKISKYGYCYLFYFLGMLGLVLLVEAFPELSALVVSGGDLSVFLEPGGDHAFKVWLSVLFSLVILLLVYKEYINHSSLRPIFIFCFGLVLSSLMSFNSYHFMNRLFLPASLFVGFFPFVVVNDTFNFKLARIMIILSILPSLRLISMLFSGDFNPL